VRIVEDVGGRIGTYVDKYQGGAQPGRDGDHRRLLCLSLHHRSRHGSS
jgi:hypothetical protein